MTVVPKEWISKAMDLEVGRELWVPCSGKKDQTRILNILERDRISLTGYFPVQASQILITRERKGKDWFVKLVKDPTGNPLYLWEKSVELDGQGNQVTSKEMVRLLIDPIQLRRLLQMREDGLGLADIAKYEGLPVEHITVLLEYAKTGNYPKPTIGRPRKY
jgi:hypothetical protein